jgi:hypothetical protein
MVTFMAHGISMPGEGVLPPGPRRSLVSALHDLYQRSGMLSTRALAAAIRQCDDCPDTVSHEGIASILHGEGISAWPKVESLVRVMAMRAVDRPDPGSEIREMHVLWLDAMQRRASRPDPEAPTLLATGAYPVGRQQEKPPTRTRFAVDIVFCLDVTGSMQPVVQEVKLGVFSLHTQLNAALFRRGKRMRQLRMRVIAYRDFTDHADDALIASPFFTMPRQAHAFESVMHSLSASGGGPEPDSGLEALSVAINSPWQRDLDPRRHLIVIFTDASTHRLGGPERSLTHYPPNVPSDLRGLHENWGYPGSRTPVMEDFSKRLVLIAPDVYPWAQIAEEWNNVLWFPPEVGAGLGELDIGEILDIISSSI